MSNIQKMDALLQTRCFQVSTYFLYRYLFQMIDDAIVSYHKWLNNNGEFCGPLVKVVENEARKNYLRKYDQ